MDTLVLNAYHLPIGLVSWQEAFIRVFSGRAQVLREYSDRVVRTVRQTFQVPAVIRMVNTVKGVFMRGPRFTRSNLFVRDNGTCQYCAKKVSKSEFQLEHVIPRSLGGHTNWENVVVSCETCNQRKSNRTPEQAKMKLLAKPKRPKHLPGQVSPAFRWEPGMPSEWRDFVASVDWWHGDLETD